MKFSIRNLVFSAAALCATTAFAANQTRIVVPFGFVVKNHAYHAGAYSIVVDPQKSLLTLSEINEPSHSVMSIVGPGNSDPDHRVSLIFDVVGSDHILRTIQYRGTITRNLDAQPKHTVQSTTIVGE
jgi:hypothetical protein